MNTVRSWKEDRNNQNFVAQRLPDRVIQTDPMGEGRDPARYEFDSRFTPPSLPPVKLTQSLTRSYADPKTEILNCRGVTPRVTETDVKVPPSRIPWNNAALKLPRNLQLLNARYTGFQYFPPVTVIASLPRRPDHRQTPTNYQAFRP